MSTKNLKKKFHDQAEDLISHISYRRMEADVCNENETIKMNTDYEELYASVESFLCDLDKLEEEAAEYQLRVLSELWDLRVQLNLAKMDGKDKLKELHDSAQKQHKDSITKFSTFKESYPEKIEHLKSQYNDFLENAKFSA